MRKYLVIWRNFSNFDREEIELPEGYKANPENFAAIIDESLNHYHGYYCEPYNIYSWSLIEE